MKAVLRQVAAGLYARWPGCLAAQRGKVAILTYHRVLPLSVAEVQWVQPGMYVTPDVFERQLAFLSREFRLISFSELLALWDQRRWDQSVRYGVITFDDGWLDTYEHAWPILQRYRTPATIFLPTDYIGTDRWFWPDSLAFLLQRHAQDQPSARQGRMARLQSEFSWLAVPEKPLRQALDDIIECCKEQPQEEVAALLVKWADDLHAELPQRRHVISWEEARRMAATGIEFGSHSRSHRIMTGLKRSDVEREASESMAVLKQQGLQPIPIFCYPNGSWSPNVAEAVEAAGYRGAVTTEFGHEHERPDAWFGIKRINIHQGVTYNESLLAFHLAGLNQFVHRFGGV